MTVLVNDNRGHVGIEMLAAEEGIDVDVLEERRRWPMVKNVMPLEVRECRGSF